MLCVYCGAYCQRPWHCTWLFQVLNKIKKINKLWHSESAYIRQVNFFLGWRVAKRAYVQIEKTFNFTFAKHLLCISNAQNKRAAGESATITLLLSTTCAWNKCYILAIFSQTPISTSNLTVFSESQWNVVSNDVLSVRKYYQLFTHESNTFLLKQLYHAKWIYRSTPCSNDVMVSGDHWPVVHTIYRLSTHRHTDTQKWKQYILGGYKYAWRTPPEDATWLALLPVRWIKLKIYADLCYFVRSHAVFASGVFSLSHSVLPLISHETRKPWS